MIDFNSTKWSSLEYRSRVIQAIKNPTNIKRKVDSFHCWNIFNDNLDAYVKSYLIDQLSESTVKKMPVISTVNIAKKIVKSEATIYNDSPKRIFDGIDAETYESIYDSSSVDTTMRRANEYYKLLRQILLQVYIDDGKIKTRVIQNHNYDVVCSDENPERASAYILSSFDKIFTGENNTLNEIRINEQEYKLKERYIVWDNDVNFVMDGTGMIVSSEVLNSAGVMPFIDVSSEKDMHYYVSGTDTLCNFTVQYNGALSDLANIVRLQGYAQAIIKAPIEVMPSSIVVGGNSVIRLVTNPDNQAEVDFDFKTPSPNIDGSIKTLEQLLANFLSTRGLDTNAISGTLGVSNTYSSGTERMLAMLDKWTIARSDLDLFEDVEYKMFELIKRYAIAFTNSGLLDSEFSVQPSSIADTFSITYSKPESVKTDQEKFDLLVLQEQQGITDNIQIMMETYNITRDQAIERFKLIVENNKEINDINGVSSALDSINQMSVDAKSFGDKFNSAQFN